MLSLVLPTYNEAKNLELLIPQLQHLLSAIPHELIVVDDDSPDHTWETAERLGARVIRRIGERGLSSAVIAGLNAAQGTVLGIMDADGQHDARLLAQMYAEVRERGGIVIGSRYIEGGSIHNDWSGPRRFLSRLATRLTYFVSDVRVTDPMSGFFMMDGEFYRSIADRINVEGFKILLEILAKAPKETAVSELPFHFGVRTHGHSKLTFAVQWQFASQLVRLWWERVIGR